MPVHITPSSPNPTHHLVVCAHQQSGEPLEAFARCPQAARRRGDTFGEISGPSEPQVSTFTMQVQGKVKYVFNGSGSGGIFTKDLTQIMDENGRDASPGRNRLC